MGIENTSRLQDPYSSHRPLRRFQRFKTRPACPSTPLTLFCVIVRSDSLHIFLELVLIPSRSYVLLRSSILIYPRNTSRPTLERRLDTVIIQCPAPS